MESSASMVDNGPEEPLVNVLENVEGEPTVPIAVHVQDDPSNASQAMVGGGGDDGRF